MHGTLSYNKELGDNMNSVGAEKPCSNQTVPSERRIRHFNLFMTVQSVNSGPKVLIVIKLSMQSIILYFTFSSVVAARKLADRHLKSFILSVASPCVYWKVIKLLCFWSPFITSKSSAVYLVVLNAVWWNINEELTHSHRICLITSLIFNEFAAYTSG